MRNYLPCALVDRIVLPLHTVEDFIVYRLLTDDFLDLVHVCRHSLPSNQVKTNLIYINIPLILSYIIKI